MFALAGAPCGCSPLLPFCGGVSLPGGATCRDNPEQAKTVPGLIGRLLLRRNSRTLTRHATVVLESPYLKPRADAGLFFVGRSARCPGRPSGLLGAPPSPPTSKESPRACRGVPVGRMYLTYPNVSNVSNVSNCIYL